MKVLKNTYKSLMNRLPYVKTLYKQSQQCTHPNGHFYSPVFSIADVMQRQEVIWKNVSVDGIPYIDLRTAEQKQLLQEFEAYYKDIPFKAEKQPNLRYQFHNGYFSYTDGIMLYSFLRHFKPKRIIEIGSGNSSALMIDTNELFLDNKTLLTFIEPYPGERLNMLTSDQDKKSTTLIAEDVQTLSLDVFKQLQAGDILFVDSTHVSKTGSDVNYILFEILPALASGVIIHFHDIFYPFEYPKDWIIRGYNWNEDYILRAFLMYNTQFEILLFPDYLHRHHKEVFGQMPLCYQSTGGSFWMRKK
ncbi:class I SAM-dependent methyltransferase [Flavobacterium sp. XGLA_31]|uniref:class I SAM-dependent methyltransferase n=1 Tax=Flavobacterium sp. XGLA_31 TaxID=3447666 RepID=UPI003F3AC54B